MKEIKIILLLLAGLYCQLSLLCAQTITLEEFLEQLKKEHPLFEKERITAQLERLEQNGYLGEQDWNLLSSITYSHEEPAIAFMGAEETDAFSLNSGIEKVFWKTGSRFSTSFTTSKVNMEIDPLYGFPGSYYQSEFAITYIQPLWKNRSGFLNRLKYNLKQFDIDFSEVLALENQESFLANSSSKFLDWVFLIEQKNIVLERLHLSEEELYRTREKKEANLIERVDVIRAEDAVRFWRQTLVLVESQLDARQAELAVLSQNDELYNVTPKFNLYESRKLIPLKEAISQLRENSRLINTLYIRFNQFEYSLKGYNETLKPDLSLVVQLSTKNADEAMEKSLKMEKPDAVLGLQFGLPIGNRTVTSQIKKTELQITQLQKQIDELTLSIKSALTYLYIQIKELENVLILNQEQIESAKEKTKEELRLYNLGRGDLTFVILCRDNEQNAKLTYAQNALTYNKLVIEYQALMDKFYIE